MDKKKAMSIIDKYMENIFSMYNYGTYTEEEITELQDAIDVMWEVVNND